MTVLNSIRLTFGICTLIARTVSAQASAVSDSSLRYSASRVAELDVRRQLPSANAATIDSLLAFYSDSVVYEHPSVGAVIRGKAALRTGMLRYLGSVATLPLDPPIIVVGPHVVMLETTASPDPREPARPIPATRKALRVLEFDARGLVRRIIDYPW